MTLWRRALLALALAAAAGADLAARGADAAASRDSMRVYFGTYTAGRSRGIYVAPFDPVTGRLGSPELAAPARNPSFLAVHPSGRFLYAVSEMSGSNGAPAGAVTSFSLDAESGKLTQLNQQPSEGLGPCHVSLDQSGKSLLVANYGSGSVALLPVQADGRLARATTAIQHTGSSVHPRQKGPHAHFITPAPGNRFALVCDLGLDKVLVYRLADQSLAPNEPAFAPLKPGSGPRHLAFGAKGRFAYVLNEIASTLTVFSCDEKSGELDERQTVPLLPDDFKGTNTAAEIQVHPSGRFVYGSNRGHNSIAVFAVDASSGKLTLVAREPTRGRTPRHFALDPTGHWLLAENQDSDSVVVFRVDGASGRLTPTGQVLEIGSPVCSVFVSRSQDSPTPH